MNVQFGSNVEIVQPVNLYGCVLGNSTFVGPFTEIQNGVIIGQHCRIQSHCLICEGVTIGDGTFIGHGVMFINDDFSSGGPARGDKTKWKKTIVGSNVSIGSNATVLPVTICDQVIIGAGAVVTDDIITPGTYIGNPARLLKA